MKWIAERLLEQEIKYFEDNEHHQCAQAAKRELETIKRLKAGNGVLVLGIPDACIDCPCHFAYDDGSMQCGVQKIQLLTDDPDTYKPSWCPIVKHCKE